MRYLVIDDGVIENAIDAPVGFELAGKLLVEADDHPEAGPGWGWLDGTPIEPEPGPPPPEPSQDERFPPLEPWRFWAVVNLPDSIGEASLRGVVASHPDPVFRAIAVAKLNNPPGGRFLRSDPLFANEALLAALNLDSTAIDELWTTAWEIQG